MNEKGELLLLLYIIESHFNLTVGMPYGSYSSVEELTHISKTVIQSVGSEIKNVVYSSYLILEDLLLRSGEVEKIKRIMKEMRELDKISSTDELYDRLISVVKRINFIINIEDKTNYKTHHNQIYLNHEEINAEVCFSNINNDTPLKIPK